MKNVTVSVDEETYRAARIAAAQQGTSVSALVRERLREIASDGAVESPNEQLLRTLEEVRQSMIARGSKFSAADRLSREELYDRAARRREEEEHREANALR